MMIESEPNYNLQAKIFKIGLVVSSTFMRLRPVADARTENSDALIHLCGRSQVQLPPRTPIISLEWSDLYMTEFFQVGLILISLT